MMILLVNNLIVHQRPHLTFILVMMLSNAILVIVEKMFHFLDQEITLEMFNVQMLKDSVNLLLKVAVQMTVLVKDHVFQEIVTVTMVLLD